jgi:carbon-monoxide dehydrogenase medium subunit
MRYEAPQTASGAAKLLASEPGAMVLAGGTDLLVQYRGGLKRPSVFVDVKRISELIGIRIDDAGLTLGAATPAAAVSEHAELKRLWPGLAEATDLIGSSQIQGRASLGGNLCNASPAADTVPALMVDAAVCRVIGPTGERTVPVEQFCAEPGKTILQRGEILLELRVPRPAPRTADAYLRMIPRTEMDIAIVGAGVSVTLDADGICTAARVAIGAVAPTALMVPGAAAALIGTRIDGAALEKAARAASAAARPIDDKRGTTAYRTKVAGVLVRRAAAKAAERARER